MRRVLIWFASVIATVIAISCNAHQIIDASDRVVGIPEVITGAEALFFNPPEKVNTNTTKDDTMMRLKMTSRRDIAQMETKKKEPILLRTQLHNAPYSGVLLTRLDVVGGRVHRGIVGSLMMVHTLSSNMLAFDGKNMKKQYRMMCRTGAFLNRGYFTKRTQSASNVFQYADKSSYTGDMMESNIKLKAEVLLKDVVFGYVSGLNDAALVLRAIDHGGVLGLNPFAEALYGGTNFLKAMVDQGLITDPSFAFSVAPDGKSQQLILGGVGKQDRKSLVYFPVVGLSPDKEPSSWAMKFEKLMFNGEVVLQDFVAEFDSSLPYGLAGPTVGSLREAYIKVMESLPKLKGADITQDTNGEILVDCGIYKSLPNIKLVAKDDNGKLHTFTFDGKDLFSTQYQRSPKSNRKKECGSSFFEDPQLDEEEGEDDVTPGRGNNGGSEDPPGANLTLRFGLGIMKRFRTIDFRAEGVGSGEREGGGGGGDLSGQIGIGYKKAKGKWPWPANKLSGGSKASR